MRFGWNRRKAEANLQRHRVDFNRATRVFEDPYLLDALDDRDYGAEVRFVGIGEAEGDILTVVHTLRDPDNDLIWLISARRAERGEVERYWQNRGAQIATSPEGGAG